MQSINFNNNSMISALHAIFTAHTLNIQFDILKMSQLVSCKQLSSINNEQSISRLIFVSTSLHLIGMKQICSQNNILIVSK